jgi:two-component system sensor histidine kinase KdpD
MAWLRPPYHVVVPQRLQLALPRLSRPSGPGLLVAAVALVSATLLAVVLERRLGVPNAAIVYLLAVVVVGTGYGSWHAVATAVASFLIYDFFLVQPLYTFTIAGPGEWLDLLLFLVVAIAIGRLSALQLQRRREAELRTAEARAMFAMSRDIATTTTALEAAPPLVARLVREAEMARVWVGLGASIGDERVTADSHPEEPRPACSSRWLLHAVSAEAQPVWVRVHDAAIVRTRDQDEHVAVYRVPIEVGGETIGSIWAARTRDDPLPGRSHTRLLAAAADQLGQSVVRDRLAAEATAAQVARESDALKSALLDSVSHDLRTPLAAIRATAGNLMDPEVALAPEEQRAAARSIDLEAERLSRLVRNMLDLSRIEGGALHPSLELYDLADLIDPVVERLAPVLAPTTPEVAIVEGLPAVKVDAIFVDQILTNLLENAARYATGSRVRIVAGQGRDGRVELVVEDAGPGVPASAMPRLFERFYRVQRRKGGREERGSGIGLAVVKGLTEAMGGSVEARSSGLGGLAIVVGLPVDRSVEPAAEPVEPAAEPVEPAVEQPAPSARSTRTKDR